MTDQGPGGGGLVPAPRNGADGLAMAGPPRAERGSETITFTPGAMAVVRQNAGLMQASVGEALSSALALQQAVLEARHNGARVLVEKQGRVRELQVGPSSAAAR
jgi:hypothetical protein